MENKGNTGLTEQEYDAVLGLLKMKTEPYEEVAKIFEEDASESSAEEKKGGGEIPVKSFETSESSVSRVSDKTEAWIVRDSSGKVLGSGKEVLQLKSGRWSAEEVARLEEAVSILGEKSWVGVSRIVLSRTGPQCREKWRQYSSSSRKGARNPKSKEMK